MANDMLIPRRGEKNAEVAGIPGWDSISESEREQSRQGGEPVPELLKSDTPRSTEGADAVCCPGLGDLFEPKFFQAISDPARIDILVSLACMGRPCTVSELSEKSPRDISVVSRHLRSLRESGVVNALRRGKQVFYWVRVLDVAERMRGIADSLSELAARYSSLNDELALEGHLRMEVEGSR